MQWAAMKVWARTLPCTLQPASPRHWNRDGVSAAEVERERSIATEKAAESGKPAEIIAKMVEGTVQKFLKEVTLLGQPFVKGRQDHDRAIVEVQVSLDRQFLVVCGWRRHREESH